MNHPRYSVLSLFDPLANTTPTSKREMASPSPDSGSDKENAEPCSRTTTNYFDSDTLTMTAFFNRTYNTHPNNNYDSPVALRKRLIDVGDVTLTADDVSNHMACLSIAEESTEQHQGHSEFDDDIQAYDDENALTTPHRRPTAPVFITQSSQQVQDISRTPLTDISLDATPVPRKSGNPLPPSARVPERTPLTKSERPKSPVTVFRMPHPQNAAPVGSPLASVINAINSTDHVNEHPSDFENQPVAILVSEPPETDDTLNLSSAYLVSPRTPLVTDLLTETYFSEAITPPSPPSLSKDLPSSHLSNTPPSTSSAADDSALLSARPRPRPRSRTTTAAFHRSSVDLHSSFNWQLQCPEASFDLINDRISFFGGESFMLDTADDLDMQAEEEMMNVLANRLREKEAGETAGDARQADKTSISGGRKRQSGVEQTKTQDYAPGSPIVTPAHFEKADCPVSSPVANSAPGTVVKPTRRRSLLAHLTSPPTVQPSSTSRRGSLASVECSPRSVSMIDEAPVLRPPRTYPHSSVEPCQLTLPIISTQATTICTNVSLPPPPSKTPVRAILPKHIEAPAPIQALRIVKRPKMHERATSISSTSSALSSAGSSLLGGEEHGRIQVQVQGLALDQAKVQVPTKVAPPPHRPVLKGVQRPLPGLVPTLVAPAVAVKAMSNTTASADESSKVSIKGRLTGALGLKARAPVSEIRSAPAPTESVVGGRMDTGPVKAKSRLQKPLAGGSGLALSRMTLPRAGAGATTATTGAPKVTTTGLRPPSRFATVSSRTAALASALPRPATSSSSRLPAPSFGTGVPRSKAASASGSGAATVGRSGTIRR
ncbi:hypothetical protein BDN67DRAFT_1012158 [Paxillus ammoniavirescens]|nr:hypothetical protein BDN67DRAFT_1012158 [Paxillus ammoniavirescens]